MALMKGNLSPAQGFRSDITPEWDDILVSVIT